MQLHCITRGHLPFAMQLHYILPMPSTLGRKTKTGAKAARKAARKAGSRAKAARTATASASRHAGASAAAGGMITSKVTARSQTTLPRGVRQVLDIKPGERLAYVIDETGVRLVNPAAASHEDPAIRQFLRFLQDHMETTPGAAVRAFPGELLARARAVTTGVEIDHDAPIEGAIAL